MVHAWSTHGPRMDGDRNQVVQDANHVVPVNPGQSGHERTARRERGEGDTSHPCRRLVYSSCAIQFIHQDNCTFVVRAIWLHSCNIFLVVLSDCNSIPTSYRRRSVSDMRSHTPLAADQLSPRNQLSSLWPYHRLRRKSLHLRYSVPQFWRRLFLIACLYTS
jgi:hypothetical protein